MTDEIQESDSDYIEGFPVKYIEIFQWLASYATIGKAKEKELELRLPICETLLEGIIGRGKVVVDDEIFEITAKRGVNIEVDEAVLNQLADDGDLTADDLNCFSWKLKVSDKIHKIPKDSNVWKALTLTPARPTLKVEKKDEDGDTDD
jgi:hypothetical protein